MDIYIANIPYEATDQDLRRLFETYGPVEDLKMLKDRETGKPRGIAFVTMDESTAPNAIGDLDGKEFMGRPLVVQKARPKDDNRDRGRNRRS